MIVAPTKHQLLATNNELLETKNAINYLRVFIDYILSWEYCINYVKLMSTAKKILSILSYYVPISVLKKVYFSIAYSHLHYGIIVWGDATFKYLNKVKVQQKLIGKVMTKVLSISSVYKELDF